MSDTQIIIANSLSAILFIVFLFLLGIAVKKDKIKPLYSIAPGALALNRLLFLLVVIHRRVTGINVFPVDFINNWSIIIILHLAISAVATMIIIFHRKE